MSISLPYALAVWRRNAVMYKRTWKWNILPNFFEPVLYLLSIGIGVGAYISEIGGTSYIAFLAPGLVCVAAMNGASFEVTYNIYVRLVFEKTITTKAGKENSIPGGFCSYAAFIATEHRFYSLFHSHRIPAGNRTKYSFRREI